MRFFFRYKWHILFWILYYIFWSILSVHEYHTPPQWAVLFTTAWFIGQASVVYFCAYGLIPRYFNTRRYIVFTVLLVVALVLSAFFTSLSTNLLLRLAGLKGSFTYWAFFSYVLMSNCYTTVVLSAVKLIRDKLRNDRRSQLLEKEKTETELRFLKSQMNPHFLFNAINSIYVLIKKDPDFAGHTLVKFADMLRYQLYECNADFIPIEKEIVYLDNYIELEKLRKGQAVCTRYEVSEKTCNFSIAPLLLIPFVENAFKYVSSYPDGANFIKVELACRNDTFELQVENSMDEEVPLPQEKGWGGIGLENVRRRLELIYKDRYTLDIQSRGQGTARLYAVLLKIQIR